MAALAVVAQAEGLRLHLSSSSSTGYKGVRRQSGSVFRAYRNKNGKQVTIGRYDSAVEAAVAYARAVGQAPVRAHETPLEESADGVQLHLSSESGTGYMGVVRRPSGRFRATHRVDGRLVNLGTYDTKVEAAVVYARFKARSLWPPTALTRLPSPPPGSN